MIIYKAQNRINGKIYIGQTVKRLFLRINEHRNDTRTLHRPFPNALKKYGTDNFSFEEIALCETKDQADFLEGFYIDFFSCRAPHGYNLTNGGEGLLGRKHSQQTKAKMRQAALGVKNHNYGLKRPPEENQKRSASLKGKLLKEKNPMFGRHDPKSERTKKRMKDSMNTPEERERRRSRMLGYVPDEKTRRKLRISILRSWQNPERRVKQTESLKRAWQKRKEAVSH